MMKTLSVWLTSAVNILLFTCCLAVSVQADVNLQGYIHVGDNWLLSSDPIEPKYLVRDSNGFKPVKAINFSLSEQIDLTRIIINDNPNSDSGINHRLYFMLWDSNENLRVEEWSNATDYDRTDVLSITLPAGDYKIAIVGQCKILADSKGWRLPCGLLQDYDDFSYDNITLVSAEENDHVSFIQRRHIGNNTEFLPFSSGYAGKFYPDAPDGKVVNESFDVLTPTEIKTIVINNYRDLESGNNGKTIRLTLRQNSWPNNEFTTWMNANNNSTQTPINGIDVFTWKIDKILSAGQYTLKIESVDTGWILSDYDDISWDDIVIKLAPYSPPPDPIKHYRLTFSDRALTCEPAIVSVQACTNNFQSGIACVESTRSTSLTLVADAKSSTDRISKPSGTFTGTTNINLGYLKEDDLTLSLTGTNKKYKCNGTSNCDINFADTGFFFSYDNADGSDDIANQVAGVNFSNPIKLDAFYNKNGQCKNIFKNNETIPVKLGVQCQEPNTCSPLNFVTNSVNLGKNNGNEENHYSAVDLAFSSNITRINTAQYQDAGKINLIASYTINDNRNDLDGLTIKGQSNQFAVRPYKFKIKATRHNGDIRTELTEQDNNVLKHVHKAGEIFTFKIQSLNADGNITSNYVPNSNDNLRIKLTRSMPKADLFEGKFSYAKNKTLLTSTSATWVGMPGLPIFDKGVYRFADSTYSEVGAIQINVKDTDYYGMRFSVDDNLSVNSNGTEIGRFIPSHFELVSSAVYNYIGSHRYSPTDYDYVFPQNLTSYAAGTTVFQPKDSKVYECRKPPNSGFCVQWSKGSNQYEPGIGTNWNMAWTLRISPDRGAVFTYMDQPELLFDYLLEAQNSAGLVTKNYNGDDKATVSFIANSDGLDLSHRLKDYGGAWVNGAYIPGDMPDYGYFSRDSAGPDGPMMNTLFGISITDKDGVVLNDLDIPAAQATARQLSSQATELRYGRWTVADGYGPMSNDFATTMQLEYFDGANFIKNNDDSITDFDFVDATLTNISLGGVPPAAEHLPALSGKGNFINGITQGLIIAAPNLNGEVKLDYTVDDWFKYNWEDGHVGFDQSPSANIVFGFFYGNDRVIYRRRLN
ncbi:hypothetical protein HWV03_01020 [Moritella sp. 36]|uniref:DUF6701 domain-containing protein n=1 Tax=Moritella sp. 36 TaxID=2746233 RepID=UPI001BA522D6|nr:DUF6701 domain-containing protein [Moritella sp. 36]QUM87515.1 hypothetical protein HWV03_01020 [Moritella sp. 36]